MVLLFLTKGQKGLCQGLRFPSQDLASLGAPDRCSSPGVLTPLQNAEVAVLSLSSHCPLPPAQVGSIPISPLGPPAFLVRIVHVSWPLCIPTPNPIDLPSSPSTPIRQIFSKSFNSIMGVKELKSLLVIKAGVVGGGLKLLIPSDCFIGKQIK